MKLEGAERDQTFTLVDAHCHWSTQHKECSANVTDIQWQPQLQGLEFNTITKRCVMSTNQWDWLSVKKLAEFDDEQFKIAFGIHPWYSHLFSTGSEYSTTLENKRNHYQNVLQYKSSQQEEFDCLIETLPHPLNVYDYIDSHFNKELVSCIGEIGLDKIFRLPRNGYYTSSSEPQQLSNIRVKMDHQLKILNILLDLSIKYSLPISVHDVKTHGVIFDVLKSRILSQQHIMICLHSFTGTAEFLKGNYLRVFGQERIFISFSKWINLDKNLNVFQEILKVLPKRCILTETDYTIDTNDRQQLARDLLYVNEQLKIYLDLESLEDITNLVKTNYIAFLSI
ncbi:hypothetical protein TBLA_0B03060 [Henningerozyma blattae CBS 6284]|uniref:Amidohydrolase-related domain-containing protein n=1 Tax=Henningerozyma blattae (strain ATCC 34711 / CBS 6284 / DSM 70876 / NBRC 10599 / NRRL Y-10934 / UCD 77-7) TaxID=1071380 RepID=I2GYE6_HENB6|nr:hypothetical protein TBLA_0B03060 [Tetrapisispora blattae CBS 6284]CCH59148.1 hypothetical protein TBLA_0B03060 [Tetrapisispora blattae CBS 6284]